MYGQGISREGNILDIGAQLDIINKSGAWYSYGDIRLGQGRENAKEYLRQNPELSQEIEDRVRAAVGLIPSDQDGQQEDAAQQDKE